MTTAVTDSLGRARRAITSCRALWREGLMPESEVFVAEALGLLVGAWVPEDAAASAPAPREEAALAALERARYRTLGRLKEALAATHDTKRGSDAPAAKLGAGFETIAAEVEHLYAFTVRRLAPPLTVRQRRLRLGLALGAAALFVGVLVWRLWLRPHATASAVYSPKYPASQAIDGMDATEWLLPDRTLGWLELRFPSRKVRKVALVNAYNAYYKDRGAERVTVTAYGPKGKLASTQGRFAKLSGDRKPLVLSLNADGVTRLRVEVQSYFAMGGGLAEVDVR